VVDLGQCEDFKDIFTCRPSPTTVVRDFMDECRWWYGQKLPAMITSFTFKDANGIISYTKY